MPNRTQEASFRSLIDRFARELTAAIAQHVEEQVSLALSRIPGAGSGSRGRPDGRLSGRLCPVPGCGKPGAGPRNRWFCKDHSKKLSAAEQKGILERNRRLEAEGAFAPNARGRYLADLAALARNWRALDAVELVPRYGITTALPP